MNSPRVLFVAGLTPISKGGWGGQLSVASGLVQSPLSEVLRFIPFSTTTRSVPPPPLIVRLWDGLARSARFVARLPSCDAVMIFMSDGLGLVEKGLFAWIARLAGKGVVVRFGSGALPAQCRRYPALELYLRHVLRNAHVVCSQGPFWTKFFENFREARGKVMEIVNGVKLGPARGGGAPAGGGHRLVFVGWMQRHKGIFEVLDAFVQILRRYPDAVLTMVGGGGEVESFRQAATQAGVVRNIRLLGWVAPEDVPRILSENDVFLLPSHHEGLPNALLEAMAAGLPVIATRVGSIPDVLDASSGILVPVGDSAAIAGAVDGLFSDPQLAGRLGAQARRVVESRHDANRIWPLYAEAVARATNEKSSPPSCDRKG